VWLVPDIAPFWGAYRPTVEDFPSAPNLSRINGRTPVGSLVQLMTQLRIQKLQLAAKDSSSSIGLERNLISAAGECGIAVDRMGRGKTSEA
jgi:hypothetical protein